MQHETPADTGHDDEHEPSPAQRRAFAQVIFERENLDLLTAGIDIGSSTSHLLIARVLFQRQGSRRAERFVPVRRAVQWRSPIASTPFLPDRTIDAARLASFVDECYAAAGVTPGDIDTGAVILTGEAIRRVNARAIGEALAGQSGTFVCATAGHHLEAVLAAHGSGATALSRQRGACGLHIDIGGGTTKLALIDRGEIVSVAALAVGGRVVAQDASGAWSRVDEPAARAAAELGIAATPEALADGHARQQIAQRLATLAVSQITGSAADDLGQALQLTEPLQSACEPAYLTFSGGVAEYLFSPSSPRFGDIAPELAAAITEQLHARSQLPVIDPGQRIRATVIGASQFSMQVSGRTVYLSGHDILPLRNIPVIHLRQPLPETLDAELLAAAFRDSARRHDTDLAGPVALSFPWAGQLTYQRLSAVARAIAAVAGGTPGAADTAGAAGLQDAPGSPLIVAVDADVAQSLGAVLTEETALNRDLVVLDGIELSELDYIDIGEILDPPGVLPVIIKSLLFS